MHIDAQLVVRFVVLLLSWRSRAKRDADNQSRITFHISSTCFPISSRAETQRKLKMALSIHMPM